jgi:hypothetical protein
MNKTEKRKIALLAAKESLAKIEAIFKLVEEENGLRIAARAIVDAAEKAKKEAIPFDQRPICCRPRPLTSESRIPHNVLEETAKKEVIKLISGNVEAISFAAYLPYLFSCIYEAMERELKLAQNHLDWCI